MSWPKELFRRLRENSAMLRIYIIPSLLFILDLVLRAVLGMNLIDAGADMALLSVATFLALLVDDTNPQTDQAAAVVVACTILFLILWIICLRIVSLDSPIDMLFIDVRPMLTWLIGLTSFVLSGAIANAALQVVQDTEL